MKKENSRDSIASIVFQVMEEEKHSDTVLHQVLDKLPYDMPDRSRIKREAYGIIERCIELDYIIDSFSKTPVVKMKPWIRTALRMAVYEIRYMEQIPAAAACNEAVALSERHGYKGLKGFVNGVLRTICREGGSVELKSPSVRFSMPEWIVRLLTDSYGKKTTAKILASLMEEKSMTLRVNTGKISPEKMKGLLAEAGYECEAGFYVKEAIRMQGSVLAVNLPGYEEGYFTIQDESSMLPVLVSGIKEGDTVLDMCAAPGGKTMQAAEKAGESGCVSSRDISEYKIRKIKENKKRLGFDNIEIKVWDATIFDSDWKERADVVIADVPCSGIGIIGRKPDIKYRISEQSLQELVLLQRKILEQAVTYVKPGGVLIFSTCTLNPKENAEQAKWLAGQYGMSLESMDDFLPEELRSSQTKAGMLQILPGIHKSDGFFVAKLRKNG